MIDGVDYRLIVVGSVIPDVDKVIGLVVFGGFDRSVFHTLFSLLMVLSGGLLLFRRFGDTRGLQLAYCWTIHLILDQMWLEPRVLLWPLYGSAPVASHISLAQFGSFMVTSLTTDWHSYLSELAGLMVLLWIVTGLVGWGRLATLLKTGRLSGLERSAQLSARRR